MTCDAFPEADLRRCFGSSADLISCYTETTKKSHQGRKDHKGTEQRFILALWLDRSASANLFFKWNNQEGNPRLTRTSSRKEVIKNILVFSEVSKYWDMSEVVCVCMDELMVAPRYKHMWVNLCQMWKKTKVVPAGGFCINRRISCVCMHVCVRQSCVCVCLA